MVSHIRLLAVTLFVVLVAAHPLPAQDAFRYREFQLGSDLASVAKLTGTPPSGARVIHARPAVMQDLEWRPRLAWRSSTLVRLTVLRVRDVRGAVMIDCAISPTTS